MSGNTYFNYKILVHDLMVLRTLLLVVAVVRDVCIPQFLYVIFRVRKLVISEV